MSKYTPEIVKEICELVESGLNNEDACSYVGINPDTLYTWKKTKTDFNEALLKAKIGNKKYHIDKIKNAGSWQSSAWYLERVYREEFAIKKEDQKQDIIINWVEDKMKKVG
jgi:hypothetical protein